MPSSLDNSARSGVSSITAHLPSVLNSRVNISLAAARV
jgi:hypothetical protein